MATAITNTHLYIMYTNLLGWSAVYHGTTTPSGVPFGINALAGSKCGDCYLRPASRLIGFKIFAWDLLDDVGASESWKS